ncbi:MAG TPA: (2Fe-2S)-binding protein [Methylomirabilota bacterium]|nr:(2Fe-2S)-binding protein [Methylomirabilota bacterium]
MYVCYCAAVTDSAVTAAIDAGAHTIEELGDRCDAGRDCGGCHPALAELLAGYERSAGARVLVTSS